MSFANIHGQNGFTFPAKEPDAERPTFRGTLTRALILIAPFVITTAICVVALSR